MYIPNFPAGGDVMNRTKLRLLALALASFTVIAGLAAYFTSSDTVTNTFSAAKLRIQVTEPHWTDNPTIVPDEVIPKDPYITNTDAVSAYVFMQVTVPVQDVIYELDTDADDKGTYSNKSYIPLFRFIPGEGTGEGQYVTEPENAGQLINPGWYAMPGYPKENKNSSGETVSYTYLYAWTNSDDNTNDTMAVLHPGDRTDTPLFDDVIFCNAREDTSLPGSTQHIHIEVFGIQTDYLRSSQETETKAGQIWALLSE